jgi:hypothetical protein
MKTINRYKKSILMSGVALIFAMTGCTDNFEQTNTNPTGLTSSQIQLKSFMQEAHALYLLQPVER